MGKDCSCRESCGCSAEPDRFQAVLLKTGAAVYSPWIARKGDYLRATAELVAKNFKNLTVQLYTKNKDDTGDGVEVNAATTIVMSSVGKTTQEWGSGTGIGLLELIRYKFSITPVPQVNVNEFVMFRMLMPCWFDAVAAPPPP